MRTPELPTDAVPGGSAEVQILPAPRWVDGHPALHEITSDIVGAMEARPGRGWWICLAISLTALLNLGGMVGYLFFKGIGIWGLNNSVGWAFDITNFVFWVGIGHAGTLISAILLLFRQQWRNSINRSAETMTIFAVMCAGMFPLIHMGRPWFFYWLMPFPNIAGVWPQFRSPLVWDVFAVTTYFTVSLVFWYIGLIPDLAFLRDKAKTNLQRVIYGVLALGWRGSAIHWRRHEKVYLMLAGIAAPRQPNASTPYITRWRLVLALSRR